MPKKVYIETKDGEIEVLEPSVAGGQDIYCPDCDHVRWQALVALSNLRGYIYMCTFCGRQTTDDT